MVRMDPVNVAAKVEVGSFTSPVPEIIKIGVLGGGCEPPILVKTKSRPWVVGDGPPDGTVRE